MDPSPLRRLLGRAEPPPANLANALADLDRLARDRPELAGPGRTLALLLRAAFGRPVPSSFPHFDPEALARARAAGIPLSRVVPPAIDGNGLRHRALALCDALQVENAAATSLRSSIRRGEADLEAWTRATLTGGLGEVALMAEKIGLDPALATSVLRLALLPALAPWSSALAAQDTAEPRSGGDCPDCGSPPLLAESRGLEQRRFLRCGLCAADWPGDRLRCPSCGEADHHALHSTFVEGEQDRYRLAHCDTCGLALKVVSTLAPLSAPALLVTELATVHLDMIAEETP